MTPTEAPSLLWQIAERFGFPAALVVLLIFLGWVRLGALIAEVGRLTRAVAMIVISTQFILPKILREQAEDVWEESAVAAEKRKEDLATEKRRRHRPPE